MAVADPHEAEIMTEPTVLISVRLAGMRLGNRNILLYPITLYRITKPPSTEIDWPVM